MRVLFFGTSEFAVPTLEALVESGHHEVPAVVTQPDRPKGRGLSVAESAVKRAALRFDLPVFQPSRVRSDDFLSTAQAVAPDVLVLAAFGQIIPQALLDLPPLGPINLHGSLLPAWRGAAPIQYAILNGDTLTGVTTMWMDATLDTGDILLQRIVSIDLEDTTGTLTPKVAQAGADLMLETLAQLEAGVCPRLPQDHSRATLAPAIDSADTEIDWSQSAERIRNRIRAMSPKPGAFTTINGRRIKLWLTETIQGESGDPGRIARIDRSGVVVATRKGHLNLMEVQPENSRRMTAAEWARGARLAAGDSFDEIPL